MHFLKKSIWFIFSNKNIFFITLISVEINHKEVTAKEELNN